MRKSSSFLNQEHHDHQPGIHRSTSVETTPRSLNSATSSLTSRDSFKSLTGLPEPKSPYSALTHQVRRIVPQEIACKFGCKGAKCKYDSSSWPKEKMSINGIFSSW